MFHNIVFLEYSENEKVIPKLWQRGKAFKTVHEKKLTCNNATCVHEYEFLYVVRQSLKRINKQVWKETFERSMFPKLQLTFSTRSDAMSSYGAT